MDQNVCRTCLRAPPQLVSLENNSILIHKIETISSVQVSVEDSLPRTICEECVQNINKFYNFRKIIINSDKDLRERFAALQNKINDDINTAIAIKEEEQTSEPIQVDVVCHSFKSELIDSEKQVNVTNKSLETISRIDRATSATRVRPLRFTPKLKSRNMPDSTMLIRPIKRMYSCNVCNFSCREYSKWQNHKRTYHYTPGICNICGKSMRTDNLLKHVRSHSSPPVPCNICGKIFKNSESLRSHSFTHQGIDHSCKICGKTYSYKGELTRHMRRQHEGQPPEKKEICNLCGKAFAYKKNLRQHMLTHTGERPYPCEYCKKGFSSGYALKTHIRQHTNERPFICEYCPMAFPQKVSLMTHIKSKHTKDDISSDNAERVL